LPAKDSKSTSSKSNTVLNIAGKLLPKKFVGLIAGPASPPRVLLKALMPKITPKSAKFSLSAPNRT
jgi:hypothetical protein